MGSVLATPAAVDEAEAAERSPVTKRARGPAPADGAGCDW
jgi:hypothetical protein